MGILGYTLIVSLLLYPFAVMYFLEQTSPAFIGAALLLIAGFRILLTKNIDQRILPGFLILAAVYSVILLTSNDAIYLKLYPCAVNIIFLAIFAASLSKPPSMIERIARASGMEISPQGIIYTRNVTAVWCVFFVANFSISGWLAIEGTTTQWASYTGFYSYIAMGTLFACEYLYRGIYQRKYRKPEA